MITYTWVRHVLNDAMQSTAYMVKYITIETTCNIYDEITYLKQEFAINGLVVFGLGSELR